MDIEELKRRIDSLDARLTELEGRGNTDEQMAKIKVGRIVTARDRLVRRYRIFTVVGMLMCAVSVILYRHVLPMFPRILFGGFFLVASMMDLYLMIGIKKIDCCSMGVAEVAEKARYYRRRHHMFMAVLIVLLVPVLGSVAVALSDDMAYICGMAVGGTVGLVLGIGIYLKIMREYRTLYGADA